MSTEPSSINIALPCISDEAAVEILNFIEVVHQLFEDHYGRQIHRHYDSLYRHNIVQSHPVSSNDDPPF